MNMYMCNLNLGLITVLLCIHSTDFCKNGKCQINVDEKDIVPLKDVPINTSRLTVIFV